MKKTNYFILAAAAALFAACSSDDGLAPEQQQIAQTSEVPVAFSAYVNRGTTRAGVTGDFTNDQLKWGTHLSTGFGVFGYYTDNQPYSETSIPNFFYNTQVKFTNGDFTYAPVKYWPNEFGNAAISEGQDRLTFFAYAPYVDVIPGTGRIDQATGKNTGYNSLTSGIVGLTSNVTTGDPYVKYFVDFDPENRVDLCWGVAKEAYTSTVSSGTPANNIAAGKPYLNVIKPETGSKIAFNFNHALAALNVQIDADVDVSNHTHDNPVATKTKIYVRSVTFEGFATKGMLNLNSEAITEPKPLWYELNSVNTQIGGGAVTIYDGRSNGKEGQVNADASNETPKDLNSAIIQTNTTTDGVTNVAKNLFNSTTLTAPIFVIPNEQAMKVTIVYDVETEDINLPGFLSDGKTKGSTVENTISQSITFGTGTSAVTKLQAGKQYILKLHLGMTSVKFDATVTAWGDAVETDVDLPHNSTAQP